MPLPKYQIRKILHLYKSIFAVLYCDLQQTVAIHDFSDPTQQKGPLAKFIPVDVLDEYRKIKDIDCVALEANHFDDLDQEVSLSWEFLSKHLNPFIVGYDTTYMQICDFMPDGDRKWTVYTFEDALWHSAW